MSGGSGGAQMPMASNQGQQMQNPQMGQQGMMGGMFGGMQPRTAFSDSASGQPYMGQIPMGSPMTQNGMGGMQPQMGGGQQMPMQNNQPYAMPGQPMGGGQQMPTGQGIQDLLRSFGALNRMNPNQVPYGSAAGQIGMGDMPMDQRKEMQRQQAQDLYNKSLMDQQRAGGTPMQTNQPYLMPRGSGFIDDTGMGRGVPTGPARDPYAPAYRKDGSLLAPGMPTNLPGRGMPPGFRPSEGPIDGRNLINDLDITKRRQMDDLPGSIRNTLPPSLRRPTQRTTRNVTP